MSSPHLARARQLGAVSGVFDPLALARAVGLGNRMPEIQDAMLAELSADVAEDLTNGYGWSLRPDARRAVLSAMISRDEARLALEHAPPLRKGDRFAVALRALLRGEFPRIDPAAYPDTPEGLRTSLAEAGAVLDAIQFAQLLPYLDQTALDELASDTKGMIIEAQRRQDMLVLLPDNHVGYEAERAALSAFLRGGPSDFDVAPVDEATGEALPFDLTSPVFVTGIGGVGKSALMARLFRWWQRRRNAPLTIVLDFDRRQLNTGSPDEMLRETLRQAAAGIQHKDLPEDQAHAIATALADMRRWVGTAGTDSATADHHTQLESIKLQLKSDFAADWAAPLKNLPIALIFDSFEALDRRGGSNVEIVLEFERALRQSEVLPNIRSVFSGREEPLPAAAMERHFGPPARRLRLKGLKPADGAALLAEADARSAAANGTDPLLTDLDTRLKISRALKNHPLTLLMAVQFIHTRPDALSQLVSDFEGRKDFDAEFAQVFLYERVLERIDDDEVCALAHPGLMLRHVNADLIRYVLAGPCLGLDTPPDLYKAEALCARLEAEYWLVETVDGGTDLRHRPDLREKMLPALLAGPAESDSPAEADRKRTLRENAIAVCSAAQGYYLNGPPSGDPAARARWSNLPQSFRQVHVLYYGSFLTDEPPKFDAETAADLNEELDKDEIRHMPAGWRARIDALVGRDVRDQDKAVLKKQDSALAERVVHDETQAQTKVGRGFSSEFFTPDIPDDASDDVAETAPEAPILPSFPPSEPRRPSPASPPAPESASPVRDPVRSPPLKGLTTQAASAAMQERKIADLFARGEFENVLAVALDYLELLSEDERAQARLQEAAHEALWQTASWQIILSAAACDSDTIVSALSGRVVDLADPALGIYRAAGALGFHKNVDLNDLLASFGKLTEVMTLDGYRFRFPQTWSGMRSARAKMKTTEMLTGRLGQLSLAVSGLPEEQRHLSLNAREIAFALSDLWEMQGNGYLSKSQRASTLVTLRDINGLYRRSNRQEFKLMRGSFERTEIGPFIARMFRGLTPEIYDPLEVALRQVSSAQLADALFTLKEEARFWPEEFHTIEKPEDYETALRTIIETTDRVGLMWPFLNAFGDTAAISGVRAIHLAISDWFFPDLRDHL